MCRPKESANIDQRAALGRQLQAILGREQASSFLSARRRAPDATQYEERLVPVNELDDGIDRILEVGNACDIYVGAAPRSGRELDVERVWCLWVDVDDNDALERLRKFVPQPAIAIQTSTEDHVQAIWPLRDPLTRRAAWIANARLAALLQSDLGIAAPEMGVRAAGTLNFKYNPPLPVVATYLGSSLFASQEVLALTPAFTRSTIAALRPGFARDVIEQLMNEGG